MVKNVKSQTDENNWLQLALLRLTRAYFALILAFVVVIVASDAWALTAPELVSRRWIMAGVMLTITTAIWYLAHLKIQIAALYKILIFLLILTSIGFATFVIYSEGGMRSRGVALYAIPIVSSAIMLSRTAIFGTAVLSGTTFAVASTRYFYVYFNEGYKAELYTTLGLYIASFFVLATLLWTVVRAKYE